MLRTLTGLGDGRDYCIINPNLLADIDQVEKGFPPNHTLGKLTTICPKVTF